MTLSVAIQLATRSFVLDVAFDVPPGVTVLFGPSGAGKSRTLACIAGIAAPDRGRIALGDEVWFDAKKGIALPIHERRVAYVFQSLALFPHMTAMEAQREADATGMVLVLTLFVGGMLYVVGKLTARRPEP